MVSHVFLLAASLSTILFYFFFPLPTVKIIGQLGDKSSANLPVKGEGGGGARRGR